MVNRHPEILLVNCDASETITEALHHADDADTIQISGTCGEAGDPDNEGPGGIPDGIPDDRMIHVFHDGIVLDGGGGFVPHEFDVSVLTQSTHELDSHMAKVERSSCVRIDPTI